MLARRRRLGIAAALVATVAVVVGSIAWTTPAQARTPASGAEAQAPPRPTTCATRLALGWYEHSRYVAEGETTACSNCLAMAEVLNTASELVLGTVGLGLSYDCQELDRGSTAVLLYAFGADLTLPREPAPAAPADPAEGRCYGFVRNEPGSEIVIDALLQNRNNQELQLGQSRSGSASNLVVGFQIPYSDIHIEVDYVDALTHERIATHSLDVATPSSYFISPCHQAYVTATYNG